MDPIAIIGGQGLKMAGRETNDMPGREDPRILIPIDVSESNGPYIDPELVDLFHPSRVILLGYFPVPDQTSPDQLRTEYEAAATDRLERTATRFETSGGAVEAVLVFTRDTGVSVDRVAEEFDCDAVLSPGETDAIDRVLVPLRGDPIIDQIVSFVGDLLADNTASVTLYHAVAADENPTEGEYILRGAADRLAEIGLERDRISWIQTEAESPVAGIVDHADGHDIVMIGESEPTLRTRILGDVPTQVIDRVEGPVLVVRRRD